jgi:hypothetical protein
MHRSLQVICTVAAALVVVAAGVAPSWSAVPGTFSIGGNLGTGIYSNDDLSDALGPDVEEITSGWEYGGSLRYQVSPRVALDLEVNRMEPKSTTEDPGNPDVELSTPGLAIPFNLYFLLTENDDYAFNLFGGAGLVTSSKFKGEQEGNPVEIDLDAESSFYGQAGFEAQYLVSPQFAFSARVLGRIAKAEIEDSDPTVRIDYSGVAFGLGARLSFGGGGE